MSNENDYDLDDDSTLDHHDLFDWIKARTKASRTGALHVESVIAVFLDETDCEADYNDTLRILANFYETVIVNGEICFRANLQE
jgi:hypothetical protein